MREVMIVRHGQSEYNAGLTDEMDSILTYRGAAQAYAVASWLRNNFDFEGYQGLVSPYHRCLQTSLLIHRYTGLDFEVIDDIREWDHRQVKVIGIPDRRKDYPMFTWTGPWPRAYMTESLDEFFVRMKKLSSSLDSDGKYLMVSHGAITRTLHGVLSGADLEDIRNRYLHDETIDPKTSVRNCSLNWVVNGQDVWFSKVVYEDVPDLDQNKRKDCS